MGLRMRFPWIIPAGEVLWRGLGEQPKESLNQVLEVILENFN